jgi:ribokinase
MELMVIGSANIDLVVSLPKIPKNGETVLGVDFLEVFGGKGAHQALAGHRAGGDIGFICKLGNDRYGNDLQSYFTKTGLPQEFFLKDNHTPTGIAQIFVSEDGDNAIGVASGANMTLSPADLAPFIPIISTAKVLLMQLEIPLEAVTYAAGLAQKNGVKVILNPAPAQILPKALCKNLWLLTPNKVEAEFLGETPITNLTEAETAAQNIRAKGIENVLITLGDQGCLLHTENLTKHYPTFPVAAVDTTAAGDVFNGALAQGITQGWCLAQAIPFAMAAAALSTTKLGAQTSIPSLGEIERFLEQQPAL